MNFIKNILDVIIKYWNNIITIILFVVVFLGGVAKNSLNYFDKHIGATTIIAALIGAVVAGGITWWAMWFIDKENKKRWQKDSLQKAKNDAIINSIWELGNLLNFIESKNLCNLKDDDLILFEWEEFDKPFKNCHDNLEKLNFFQEEETNFYKKIEKTTLICEICANIFYKFKCMKEDKKYYDELKKKGFYSSVSNVLKIKLIKSIEFLKNKNKNNLHEEFENIYNYNFVKLIEEFLEIGDEVYKDLKKMCEL